MSTTDEPHIQQSTTPAPGAPPSSSRSESIRITHPVRGVLWGLLLGLGLMIVMVVTGTITLSLIPMLVVWLIGAAIGVLWSLFGPAKR